MLESRERHPFPTVRLRGDLMRLRAVGCSATPQSCSAAQDLDSNLHQRKRMNSLRPSRSAPQTLCYSWRYKPMRPLCDAIDEERFFDERL